MLAAITTTLAWGPLMRKRISRLTAESLPWWLQLFGTLIGASVDADRHEADRFCGIAERGDPGPPLASPRSRISRCSASAPEPDDLFAFQTLVGLLLTNGPGAISAQGAKGAVSADGPETPERVQLNKALVGFLTHTGYAHGGNGYEGIAFLIEQFRDSGLDDPARPGPRRRPEGAGAALRRASTRATSRPEEDCRQPRHPKLPGVNHPVFKDKPVNHDPREVFICGAVRGARRIQRLPRVLPRAGAGAVRCRRVAQRLLRQHRRGDRGAAAEDAVAAATGAARCPSGDLETAAFTIFLYARMLGCAAEIDDHLNRGRNMDTRTPASQCRFVA